MLFTLVSSLFAPALVSHQAQHSVHEVYTEHHHSHDHEHKHLSEEPKPHPIIATASFLKDYAHADVHVAKKSSLKSTISHNPFIWFEEQKASLKKSQLSILTFASYTPDFTDSKLYLRTQRLRI